MKEFLIFYITGFIVQIFADLAIDIACKESKISMKMFFNCILSALVFPVIGISTLSLSIYQRSKGRYIWSRNENDIEDIAEIRVIPRELKEK